MEPRRSNRLANRRNHNQLIANPQAQNPLQEALNANHNFRDDEKQEIDNAQQNAQNQQNDNAQVNDNNDDNGNQDGNAQQNAHENEQKEQPPLDDNRAQQQQPQQPQIQPQQPNAQQAQPNQVVNVEQPMPQQMQQPLQQMAQQPMGPASQLQNVAQLQQMRFFQPMAVNLAAGSNNNNVMQQSMAQQQSNQQQWQPQILYVPNMAPDQLSIRRYRDTIMQYQLRYAQWLATSKYYFDITPIAQNLLEQTNIGRNKANKNIISFNHSSLSHMTAARDLDEIITRLSTASLAEIPGIVNELKEVSNTIQWISANIMVSGVQNTADKISSAMARADANNRMFCVELNKNLDANDVAKAHEKSRQIAQKNKGYRFGESWNNGSYNQRTTNSNTYNRFSGYNGYQYRRNRYHPFSRRDAQNQYRRDSRYPNRGYEGDFDNQAHQNNNNRNYPNNAPPANPPNNPNNNNLNNNNNQRRNH